MTWQLWTVAALVSVTMFGLGCVFARAHLLRHHHPDNIHSRLVSNSHANAILAVFFTAVALTVAVDTIQLQIRFDRFTRHQVDCHARQMDNEVAISEQRRVVDQAAANYDIAMREWATIFTTRPLAPADDPAYVRMQDTLSKLVAARITMLQTYADHPVIRC